jgi:protocatechuate 3,4-dioxygenase beta subunit
MLRIRLLFTLGFAAVVAFGAGLVTFSIQSGVLHAASPASAGPLTYLQTEPSSAITGTVIGAVTGADGAPLSGIAVYAQVPIGDNDWFPAGQPTQTNASGRYTLTAPANEPFGVTFADDTGTYAAEGFNVLGTGTSMRRLTVAPGATLRNVNARLLRMGSISGRVTDAAGNPLAGIAVNLAGLPTGGASTTDANGRYTYPAVPPGTYQIWFGDAEGRWILEWYDNVHYLIDDARPTSLVLGDGTRLSRVDARLSRPGRISGRVLDYRGQPADAWALATLAGSPAGTAGVSAGEVQDDGSYVLGGLAPGRYRIRFIPRLPALAPIYFGQTHEVAQSTAVAITDGGVVTGINGTLGPGAQIQGIVRNSLGSGQFDVFVHAWRRVQSSEDWEYYLTWQTGDFGYESGGMGPGTYRIQFGGNERGAGAYQYYNAASSLADAMDIVLPEGGRVTNVDAQLSAPAWVRTTVVGPNGTPLRGIRLIAYREASDWWEVVSTDVSRADGAISLMLDGGGVYRLQMTDPGGEYAQEYYNNALTLGGATDLAIATGQQVTLPAISLARSSSIAGNVVDANGEPVAHVTAEAWLASPQAAERGANPALASLSEQTWELYSSAPGSDMGTFLLAGLAEGTYQIRLVDPSRHLMPAFIGGGFEPGSGASITVGAEETLENVSGQLTVEAISTYLPLAAR